jgi:hypothetical protein
MRILERVFGGEGGGALAIRARTIHTTLFVRRYCFIILTTANFATTASDNFMLGEMNADYKMIRISSYSFM